MDNGYSLRVSVRVREAFEASGATLNGLATATGIPRNTLRRRIDGHQAFTVDQLASLSQALGVPVASLLVGDDAA